MFYIYPLVFPRGQTYAFAAEKAVNLYPFKTNRDLFFLFVSPQDSTTWIAPGFQLPGILVIFSGSFILDSRIQGGGSGFLQLHVFRISQAQFPGFRNPDSVTCRRFVKHVSMFLSSHLRQSENMTK